MVDYVYTHIIRVYKFDTKFITGSGSMIAKNSVLFKLSLAMKEGTVSCSFNMDKIL